MFNSSLSKNNYLNILFFCSFIFFTSCDVSVSNNFPYQTSANLAIIFQFIIILFTDIVLGGGCLLLGGFLFYKGLTGNAIVMIELNSLKATIINCTPGMFLVIAGVMIVLLNRFNVNLGIEKKEKSFQKKIFIIIIIFLVITAIGFCSYGAYMAYTNNVNWFQKI